MIKRTYIEKCNTIVKGNNCNLGINPILELNYGRMISRFILKFDHSDLKKMVDEKIYVDTSKLKHYLKMTNCGSLNQKEFDKKILSENLNDYKERATSFDIILFLIPEEWDEGRGFDFVDDLFIGGNRSYSKYGSNWYNSTTIKKWDNEGIFSPEFLSKEFDKFTSKEGNLSNIIIAKQHFDYGNENINVDITDTVNKFISGEIINNGIGVAFLPKYEYLKTEHTQYVGFFSNHTNTFFEPFLETYYEETIDDDRNSFFLNKENKLYFFSNINGVPSNLDELPTCEINGINMPVKQATKGVYYAIVKLSSNDFQTNIILNDVWGNIKYCGNKLEDVEQSFVIQNNDKYFVFTDGDLEPKRYIPSIYGIKDSEKIKKGDVRKIIVSARIPYTNKEQSIDNLFYRIYIHDGTRELDITPWLKTEKSWNHNYFIMDTNQYLPNRYYIDIKVVSNMEKINYEKMITFDIINNVTEVYT